MAIDSRGNPISDSEYQFRMGRTSVAPSRGTSVDIKKTPGQYASMSLGGMDLVINRLHQMKESLSRQVAIDALKKGAKVFQSEAVLLAPMSEAPHILKSYASAMFKKYTPRQFGSWITPGNLKKNIKIMVDRERTTKDQVRVVVYIGSKAWYGTFREFGTSRAEIMPRKSFMRPAFDTKGKEATDAVVAHLHAVLESGGFVK